MFLHESIRTLWKKNLTASFLWAEHFNIVAKEFPKYSEVIFESFQRSVDSWRYNDSAPFLALLYELALQLNRTIDKGNCREYLKSRQGKNRAATFARDLLNVTKMESNAATKGTRKWSIY